MKRMLNLNEPSSKMIAVIGLFLVAIPLGLAVIALLLGSLNVGIGAFDDLIKGSLVVGLALAAAFLMLMLVEQIQDHFFDRTYRKHRSRQLPLPDGNYECQYCGNRKVIALDKCCAVCGQKLK